MPESETTSVLVAPPPEERHESINCFLFIIGFGVFVTTIAQVKAVGLLPLQIHLKEQMGLSATMVAAFLSLGTMAWNIKPLFGLVADSVPLFGTQRRHWLILSSILAGLFWLGMAPTQNSYSGMLWMCVALNGALVMASTVVGGLLVVEGQKHGATGRFSSMRLMTQNLTSLIIGPLSGYLAARAFGLTAGIGAGLMFTLAIAAALTIKEPRDSKTNREVWVNAWIQLKAIGRSKTMWAAAGMLFFVMVSPGFNTPLVYFQREKLHFTTQQIGNLQFWGAGPGLLAATAYALLCKKITLRPFLFFGILTTALSTIGYLWFTNYLNAAIISAVSGFFGTLALIALMDMAARATPSGSGSFGYALMMSVYNIAIMLSDIAGSWLFDHTGYNFHLLVWVNAGTTALMLLVIPFLPSVLMNRRDG
jgi:MFS family permease